MNESMNDFNKSYQKLISKKDEFWSALINYLSTIPKIDGLRKTHKPEIT